MTDTKGTMMTLIMPPNQALFNERAAKLFKDVGWEPNAYQKGVLGISPGRGAGHSTVLMMQALAVALYPHAHVVYRCKEGLTRFHAATLRHICALADIPIAQDRLPGSNVVLCNGSIVHFTSLERKAGDPRPDLELTDPDA